jgi:NADH-quinone oxidoreductase subunit M
VYSARAGHPGTFLFSQLTHVAFSTVVQKWLFLGFFIAFAIKAPLWPFHTWLPDAATAAQPGSAVLLVGVLDKVGTFGMIRYCLQLFPTASRYFTPLILVLAVVGILYGAIVAIGQADLKRLIAYTSISHFGFIVLGIFALTSQGGTGATLYMVNHGFATGALFLIAGFMIVRRRSQRIADYGGVQKVAPVLAGLFLISGLAGLSLPGLSTFVSEFLVLLGTFTRYKVAASFATAGIILAAIYILWMYQRTMTGPVREEVASMPDLKPRELWAVGPLIALLIFFGVYPKPLLDLINPAVQHTLVQVHVTDPVPQHPSAELVLNLGGGRILVSGGAQLQKGSTP